MNMKRKLRKGRRNGFFKHKGRRILAFALALVLIVGVVPDMAIVVKAGEPYQFDPVVDSVTFYDDGSVKSITASTNWQWTGSENYWVALLLGEGIATQHSGYTYAQWYRRQNRYHTLEDSLRAASVTNIANTDFIGPVANTSSHGVSRTLTLPKGTIKPGENKEYYLYIWTHDDHTSSGEGIGYYPDCVVANVQTTIDSIYIKRRDNGAELFSWTGNSVTLDKQNGAGGSDSVVVKNGSAMPIISVPTRSGYVFGGYYESTSNGSQYYTASGTSARNWDKSSDSTLYARWVYIPVITGPSNVSMTYGESGKTVSVSVPAQTSHSYTYQWYVNSANNNTGGTAVSGATSASYTIPTGKTAGTTEYYYCVVTATRSDCSQTATAVSDVATVTVNKVLATIGTAPVKVDNLIYTGSAQELVTAGGDVTGGTLQYALGTDSTTAPTSDWGTDIPTKTDVGTYYVWYKVVGDENHNDTNPVCIKVTIEEKKDTDTSIKTEVEADKDAPDIKVDNFDETLAEKLLTDEEKEAYEAGTPVLVYLEEKVVDKKDVSAEDMTAIEKTIADEGYTYGVCLDLSLWKKLGNNAAVQIHNTNGNPIKITVSIPDTLKNAPEGYTRTYQIVRVHDGVATVLAEGTGDTLTLSSDKFSSYFIVYKDAKKAADDKKQDTPATADTPKAEVTNTDNANKDNKISTGDKMHIGIIIMLMIDSAMAAFYLTLRKKKIK